MNNHDHDIGYLKAQAETQAKALERMEGKLDEVIKFKHETVASKKTMLKLSSASGAAASFIFTALYHWLKP